MTDPAPILADTLTGWHRPSPGCLLPTFATGFTTFVLGAHHDPQPGRVDARPTAHHRRAYALHISAEPATPTQEPDAVAPDGTGWRIAVRGEHWNNTGTRAEPLPWQVAGRLRRDVLAPSLAAYLAGPDAEPAAAAAMATKRAEWSRMAARTVADIRADLAELERIADTLADPLTADAVALADAAPLAGRLISGRIEPR